MELLADVVSEKQVIGPQGLVAIVGSVLVELLLTDGHQAQYEEGTWKRMCSRRLLLALHFRL